MNTAHLVSEVVQLGRQSIDLTVKRPTTELVA